MHLVIECSNFFRNLSWEIFKLTFANVRNTHCSIYLRKCLIKGKRVLIRAPNEDLWYFNSFVSWEYEEALVITFIRNRYTFILIIEIVEIEGLAFFKRRDLWFHKWMKLLIVFGNLRKSLHLIFVLELNKWGVMYIFIPALF